MDKKKTDEKEFDFWGDHSRRYLEMAFMMDRFERLEHPDGYGRNTGDCGDTVEFFLTIKNDRLVSASFDINGCVNTRACANAVAELTEGKTISEAWEITYDQVIEFLETLHPGEHHCAQLAVGAFYKALSDYREKRRDPWKKAYRSG